jgi:hypothetical protein
MPIKPKKNKTYEVKVSVDRNGKFTYNPSTVQPNPGDTISWSVTLRGGKTAFQVEFPCISPFAGGGVFRSASNPTPKQTVDLLPNYKGNLVFKYAVTVSNGWSDDPVIGPVPADPHSAKAINTQVILLNVDGNGDLTITPPAQPLSTGVVMWQWNPTCKHPDDFVLKFDQPGAGVLGWPLSTNSHAQIIALNMKPAGSDGYTITTVNTGLSKSGTLTIN